MRALKIRALCIGLAAAAGVVSPAVANEGRAQKLQACKALAVERGFTFGAGRTKGAIKPKDFVRDCMSGKQR